MSKSRRQRRRRSAPDPTPSDTRSLRFSPVNGVLAAAGLASLVVGYWLLSRGDITLAPILLVLGYVVLLPMAIIL